MAVELLDKRGRTRKCYRLDDGRLQYDIRTGPMHWLADSVWEEFDLRWHEVASGLWVPSASDVVMELVDNVLTFTTPLGHTVAYEVPDRISTALTDENTVTITADQGSVTVRNHPLGVRQAVVCNMKQNKVWELTYPSVLSEGVVWQQVHEKCVDAVTPDGERLHFIVEEAVSADGSHHPEAVSLTVYKGDLRLVVDDTMLDAPYTITCPDTFYTGSEDGYLRGGSTTYTTAADMYLAGPYAETTVAAGQSYTAGTYYCREGFIRFNTAALDGEVVAATLGFYLSTPWNDTDFILQARTHTWGPTIETDDGVPDHDLSGKTLLAQRTSASWPTGAYADLTSEAAFLAAINTEGYTEMLLCSNRQVGNPGTAPTGNEYMAYEAAEGTYPPRLVVICGPAAPTIDASQVDDDIQVAWS